ncbi:sigma-54-dependent Fis family transcriptional regulator [Xanthobacter sp. V4C-4]|uniref:sigma-54-dependent Fis family transcriptional regulator n=1 Tax=Xanthobacter cornucopiae TaxID=3119924 RepID=UPI00372A06AF
MLQTVPFSEAHLFSAQAVAEARHRFFSGEAVADGVAPPILRSWTRCAARGLPTGGRLPAEPLAANELRQRREKAEALRRRCRPELEALHAEAAGTGSIVILTDPTGLVLDTVGSADFADRAAKVALLPGVSWSETALGTNAIGTALVERRALEVRGAEHYAEAHGILSCAAAPILDPFGEVVGLLDVSGPAAVAQMHALGLVRLAVGQVEHRLFEGAFPGHTVVRFHSDPSFLGTSREGILVFEDYRLVAANRPGLAQLGLGWDALANRRYADLFDGSLGRAGEDRRVRSVTGDTLHVRVEAPAPQAAAPRPPAPRTAPPAGAEPCFDPATQQALGRAIRLLDAGVPVLVQGETGAGKEVFSRQMHRQSSRAGKPFAAVNCAALPEGLIESELFGYEDGAFTGARRAGFKGLLREADGGVLFLDEIGDMPLALQTRLLRVLQEREVTPLGGGRPVAVDFRLICASHRDLKQLVDGGRFRADLYFRIAQYTVALPALRHLPDREALVRRFWRDLDGSADAPALSDACVAALARQPWPGNFRQFVGTLKVLHALAEPGCTLDLDALPPEMRDDAETQPPAAAHAAPAVSARPEATGGDAASPAAADNLNAVTRATIQAALAACNGNISMAARRLGIHRSTLHRHLAAGGGRPGKLS